MKKRRIPPFKIQNNKILSIDDLYPAEIHTPEQYVEGIPKNILLRYAFLFLRDFDQMKYNESSGSFLRRYFAEYSSKIYFEWEAQINLLAEHIGVNVTILYPLSNFKFFEIVFKQPDFEVDESDTEYKERSNINILKCYLSINKIFVDKEMSAANAMKTMSQSELLLRMSLMGSLMESDITKDNPVINFACQYAKCKHFFKFLLNDHVMKGFLRLFLQNYGTSSVAMFMARLAVLFHTDNRGHDFGLSLIHTDSEKYPNLHKFVQTFILTEISDEHDFLEIRRKPLIEINSSTFAVVYEKFVIDKLYKGLFFGVGSVVKENESGRKINYLSDVGDHFFEKVLAYHYLERLTKPKSIKRGGADIFESRINRGKNDGGEPDYYIRDFNNIFVFEVKNTLIRSDIKYSFEYDKIEEYLKERFLYNTKGKGKIIVQLVENIKKIIDGQCDYDKVEIEKIKNIYPIAILPDETFSSYGLNFITNRWFKSEVSDLILKSNKVTIKPMIIVTIDTIICISFYVHKGYLTFRSLLDLYIKNHLESEVRSRQKVSFSMFVTGHIKTLGLSGLSFEYFKLDNEEQFSEEFV
jgi:hypothetical protein